MLFRQLFDNESCTYTYILASGYGREAVIIDPVFSHLHNYVTLLEQLKLKLVFTIDTHIHADHITASGGLQQKTNAAILMGERSPAEFVSYKARDNEIIDVDGLKLQCLYTPGHTDDSYCFYYHDRVFTGDTLFIRGTGRTDFQNGDPYQQYNSIMNQLFTLQDDTFVYPGHDYKGMTVSTIVEEKKFNPRLQVKSADEYAEIMNNLNLPYPKKFDEAHPANLKCGTNEIIK